uniref:Uncharacterized protein n=1 Tax=Arundo donax TaxID=35708 RepID=A0A0A9FYT8_ARUDO
MRSYTSIIRRARAFPRADMEYANGSMMGSRAFSPGSAAAALAEAEAEVRTWEATAISLWNSRSPWSDPAASMTLTATGRPSLPPPPPFTGSAPRKTGPNPPCTSLFPAANPPVARRSCRYDKRRRTPAPSAASFPAARPRFLFRHHSAASASTTATSATAAAPNPAAVR